MFGNRIRREIVLEGDADVICYIDSDTKLQGKQIDGIAVRKPEDIKSLEFDKVVIASWSHFNEIKETLSAFGVPISKIDASYVETCKYSRINFCKRFSEIVYADGIIGSVAEAGVFQGDFSSVINKYFYDRTCYLFDTFEGFSEKDIAKETEHSTVTNNFLMTEKNWMARTSEDYVYERMPNKDRIVICKGFFPEAATGINDTFCFVNLDMDLYQPTIDGLRFFYPKMVSGGIILIHDYFSAGYYVVDKAVADFEKEIGYRLYRMPIGDDHSIAILKK